MYLSRPRLSRSRRRNWARAVGGPNYGHDDTLELSAVLELVPGQVSGDVEDGELATGLMDTADLPLLWRQRPQHAHQFRPLRLEGGELGQDWQFGAPVTRAQMRSS